MSSSEAGLQKIMKTLNRLVEQRDKCEKDKSDEDNKSHWRNAYVEDDICSYF